MTTAIGASGDSQRLIALALSLPSALAPTQLGQVELLRAGRHPLE
jgi:hypothetical protein